MSNRLKLGRHLLLSCSALFPVLMAPTPALPQAVNLGGAGNFIAPDGLTGTSVTNNGATTDVRTSTVRGDVGFNSFSRFEAGAGNTVNLHLPQNTGTLVNVVRDAPVVVEGTVNSLKNGAIGGNVVFSDPYGFVLGKDGVINTGGLSVNTPTRQFLDEAIGANGIDTSKTNRLISGDVPISPDGSVVIRGRVNAQTHIDIHAASIDIDSQAKLRRHRENFEASVNTAGAGGQGGALVVRDGRIQLVATGDVTIGGSVAARATSRESAATGAGRVSVKAGGNVTITPTARIEALVAIARDQGADAVTAIVGIEATRVLEIAGDVSAIGQGAAGASVNLVAERAAVKAGALIVAQIAEGAKTSATVDLKATGDVALSGRIEARGADNVKGGTVTVSTDRVLAADSSALIDVSGAGSNSGGGSITLAGRTGVEIKDAPRLLARGSGASAGAVSIASASGNVALGDVVVDLNGPISGEFTVVSGDGLTIANTRTIDANTIFRIKNAFEVADGGLLRSGVGTGRHLKVEAGTIKVASGGTIDMRALDASGGVVGHSGTISLSAATIDLAKGSIVRTDGGRGFSSGDITLLAQDTVLKSSGISKATASISIGGKLYGQNISARAVAKASAQWLETDLLNEDFEFATTASLLEIPKLLARFGSLPLAIDGGLNYAESAATVTVLDGADIKAMGDLELAAVGTQVAANLGMNVTTGAAVQLGVFAGVVDAKTTVRIEQGASVDVAGDLSLSAQNTATLSVNAFNLGLKDTPISGTLAVALADIDTQATIGAGATVTVGGKVRVAADNINSFEAVATSMALQDGVAGAAIAIQHHDAFATAAIDATINGRSGAKIGDVSVTSVSETILNRTAASTTLGDNAVIRLVRNKVGVKLADKAVGKFPSLGAFLKNSPIEKLAQDEMPKGAVSLALGLGNQGATARIGESVVLNSSGNVSVIANVLDWQVRANADVSIGSAEEKGDGPKTTDAVGIAINIADFDHKSHATIGRGADITAGNLGISATSRLPINIAYQNATTPLEWIMALKNAANGNLGVVKNILTSYAASEVTSDGTGIGASINYLGIGHDVLAWVGAGAKITTTDASTGTWDAAVRTSAPGRMGSSTFDNGVDIAAESLTESINIAGSPAWMLVIGGNESTSPEGRSIGGAFTLTSFDAKTIAGIGAGATVSSARDLSVTAQRTDTVFTVAPSSGKGAGFGISGMLSMTMIDNNTAAAIDSRAIVSAARIVVDAAQHNRIVSIAGALNSGNGTNVGLAANWSNIVANTQAFIGNTNSLVSGDLANNSTKTSEFETDDLRVAARTTGDVYALSVTAALSMPNTGEKGRVDKVKDDIAGGVGKRADKHNAFAAANKGVLGSLSGKIGGLLGDLAPVIAAKPTPAGQKPDFSMAAAGSVTGSTLAMKTSAYLEGVDIKRLSSTGSVGVTITATNDTLISVTSGAASVALAGQDSSKSSGAVAGAVAVAVTNNDVYAGIRGSTLVNAGATHLRALSSGQQIILGLGLAVNTNANSAYSLAGSVSFGFVGDGVNAEIQNSKITGEGSASDVSVKAYQNTDIGIGGLAVSVATSGAGGFGLAISGTVIADPVGGGKAVSAAISGSTLKDLRNVTVDAATLSRVLSGAGSVGVAPNGLGFTGSIVFNDISGTTYAGITGSLPTHRIDATEKVLVRSGAKRTPEIATELAGIIRNTAIASGFDFSGTVLGTDTTGSVILGVSGAVGFGKNSAGFSLLYNGVRHTHEARVEGVTIDTDGDIVVSATDDTKIIGTAAGISVATGEFGGAGSIVVSLIKNQTKAVVERATLDASDVSVLALNTSFIGAGAGAVGIGASAQGTGLGISLISGTIANDTDASLSASTVTARDVEVDARSAGEIVTAAVSVGVGGTVGIAGSLATSLTLNDARALVGGSTVTASNNVLVNARNVDSVYGIAGAAGISLKAAGVGLSSIVSIVRGETVAAVDGGSVTARGEGTQATVDDGQQKTILAHTAENVAKSLVGLSHDISNGTRSVRGLSIGAHSQQKVISGSLAVAVAINADTIVSVAGAVSPVVNVLAGRTEARLSGASVETGATNPADVLVLASSNVFAQNAVVAAAGATGVAGAGGFVSNLMARTTLAKVDGARIGTTNRAGGVEVLARSVSDTTNLVSGMSVGIGAVAGSMVVNVFDGDTTASLAGGKVNARGLDVKADSKTSFLGLAKSVSVGTVAAGGAMNLTVNQGSTNALVGLGDRNTEIVLSQDLSVDANAQDRQSSFVVGASLGVGSGVGVAGMLNLSVFLSDTVASVNRLTASSMRNVSVLAKHDVSLLPVTGGFGASFEGAGIGAAANVMLTKAHVRSEILDSAMTASGTLKVDAEGLRQIEMITATLGAGGSAGIGAAIGVVVAGVEMSGDALRELNATLNAANSQSNQNVDQSVGSDYSSKSAADVGESAPTASGSMGRNRVADALANTKRDSVTARIVGGTITATSGATEVTARSGVRVRNFSLGAGIGGAVGVGAAVGYTFVNQAVTASVTGTHTLSSLKISALAGDLAGAAAKIEAAAVKNAKVGSQSILSDGSVTTTSIAGAGSLLGAAGAAVAVSQVHSDVAARLGGDLKTTGTVTVEAADRTSVRSNAIGAAVSGGIALGISVAVADRDATVTAELQPSGSVDGASKVSIDANSEGAVRALAGAGAGGLLGAGVGASATALDNSRVLAAVGTNAQAINIGAGGIGVTASSTPNLNAFSVGAALGGHGAVGASIALARGSSEASVLVGSNAKLKAVGAVNLKASHVLAGTGYSSDAKSIAGAGGILFSAQASVAEALTSARTRVQIADDSEIEGASVTVSAATDTAQRADVTGIAVGGGLALGASVAEARSDNSTVAELGARVRVRAQDLSILANGQDDNEAVAEAGGGALLAGMAAEARTSTTSRVLARLGAGNLGTDLSSSADDNDVLLSGRLTIEAKQLSLVNGGVDSVQASAIGRSGSTVRHNVATDVRAIVADNALVSGISNLTLAASNRTQRVFGRGEMAFAGASGVNVDAAAWNLRSGSGGIADVPAGKSETTISHTTHATVGNNATILLPRRVDPADSTKTLVSDAAISAYNEIVVFDKVRLDSGGAISVAKAEGNVTVTKNEAAVAFGDGSRIVLANGNLNAAAYDNAFIDVRVAATTWGLAGAPIGLSTITYNRANTVTVGQNALLETGTWKNGARGTIGLRAGAGLDGTLSSVTARAYIDLFNKTVIAIPTTPDPRVVVQGDSVLAIQSSTVGKGVRAAGDIYLTASRGNVNVAAVGTGKDIYRETLATVVNGITSLFGQDGVSFDYKGGSASAAGHGLVRIDGTVETGIERKKSLVVSYADSCGTLSLECLSWNVDGQIDFDFATGISLDSTILSRIAELRELLTIYGNVEYNADGSVKNPEAVLAKAAYEAEIKYYEDKLGRLELSADGSSLADLSPYAQRERLIANTIRTLSAMGTELSAAASTMLGIATTTLAETATTFGGATALQTDAKTILDVFVAANAKVSGLSGYKGDTASGNTAHVATINAASAQITGATAAITDAQGKITAARATIDARVATIRDTPGQIDAKLTLIASATGDARTALVREVIALRNTLSVAIDAVADAQMVIRTQTEIIDAKTIAFESGLKDIRTATRALVANSATASDASDGTKNSDAGIRTQIETALTSKETELDTLRSGVGTIRRATDVVVSDAIDTGQAQGTVKSYIREVAVLAGHDALLPNESKGSATIPTTGRITVRDTSVRLGDIVIVTDRLEGGETGKLSAPGDAEITIQNHTSNILKTGNLTIEGSSGGRILINGGNARDKNAASSLTTLGSSLAAGFQFDTLATTTASAITIENLYDSGSKTYFDPTSSRWHMTSKRPAPDLVLSDGSLISNALGSVTIFSARGNIQDNASIQARSLSVTARNGDYIQSYDHKPRHIAGDPYKNGATGYGHQINGEIRMSARILNINGLVRSGYAERSATIASTDLWLVGKREQINLTSTQRSQIDAFLSNRNGATKIVLASGLEYRFIAGDGLRRADAFELWITPELADTLLLKDTGVLRVATAEFIADRLNEAAVRVDFEVRFAADGTRSAGRFVVEPTEVRGGHIELFGQIMNTGAGRIEVLDGFGQIKVDNKTSRQLVVSELDAGRDLLGNGRGTGGYLKITDIRDITKNAKGEGADAQTTYAIGAVESEYVRRLENGAYKLYLTRKDGAIGTNGAFAEGTFKTVGGQSVFARLGSATAVAQSGDNRTATYAPQANLRYVTQDAYEQTVTRTRSVEEKTLFGIGWLVLSRNTTYGNWNVNNGPEQRKDNGAVVFTDASMAGNTLSVVSSSRDQNVQQTNWNSAKSRSSADAGFTRIDRWTETEQTTRTVVTTDSHKADYGIGIRFIGSDTGTIDVASVGSILLTGGVNNAAGSVKIAASGTSAGIQQESGHTRIVGRDIDLSSTSGSVGSIANDAAIQVTLGSGRLAASAGSDIAIEADGGLALGRVVAGNRISIDATTDIGAASGGQLTSGETAFVQSRRVDLVSGYGSIGSLGNQLVVNTANAANGADRPFGDPDLNGAPFSRGFGLSARAAGDIGIRSTAWTDASGKAHDGTILVDRVVAGGSVKLSSAGAILDNLPEQKIDTRTLAELDAWWKGLGLTGTDATAKANEQIAAFETQMTDEKRLYDQLLGQTGGVYDPAFAYRMSEPERVAFGQSLRAVDAQTRARTLSEAASAFEAKLRVDFPGLAEGEIAAKVQSFALSSAVDYDAAMDARVLRDVAEYETTQTGRYHGTDKTLADLTGSFATGVYVSSAAERQARTDGVAWSDAQLLLSLSAGALKTVTGTNPVIKLANVSGNVVTLVAAKGIGEATDDVSIRIDKDGQVIGANGLAGVRNLSQAQRIAIATAEGSDFLTVDGTKGADGSSELLRLRQIRMLNFDARSRLDVDVTAGNAHLASLGAARLGSVSVPGELRLKVRGSIVNASDDRNTQAPGYTPRQITAGSYILEASLGGIGWSRSLDTGLFEAGTLRITQAGSNGNAGSIVARAADSISLNVVKTGGDDGAANVDTIYSRKTIELTAGGDIRNANGNDLLNILGESVTLTAGGSIGSSTQRLNVGNGLGGRVSATAEGSIHLFAPDDQQLTLANVVARGGGVDVLAGDKKAGAILVGGLVSAQTDAVLKATGRIAFGAAGSLLAKRDVSIDAASLLMIQGSGIEAAGTIAVTTSGDAQLTNVISDEASAAAITVTASGRILGGSPSARTDLTATSAKGGVVLAAVGGIGDRTVANLDFEDASVTNALNHLRVDAFAIAATSDGTIAIRALRDVGQSSFASSKGNVDVIADGALTSSTITAADGSVEMQATGALDLGVTKASGSVTIDTASTATFGSVTSGGTQTLASTGNLGFGTLTTTAGDVSLTSRAGSVIGTTVDSASNVTVSARNAVDVDTLGAAASVGLTASGSIALGSVTAAATLDADAGTTLAVISAISGGTQTLSATSELGFGTLTTGGDLSLTSGAGSVTGTNANSIRNVTVSASNAVNIGTLDAAASVGLTAGGSITLGTVDNGTTLDADAGTTLAVISATSGGTQTLSATSELGFGTLTTGGDLSLTSGAGSVTGTNANSIRNVTVSASNAVNIGTLDAAASVGLTAGGSITLGTVDNGTTLDADAGTTLAVTSATSGGTQTLASTGNLGFGTLTTTAGDVSLTSRAGSVTGTNANSIRNVTVSASNAVNIGTLDAAASAGLTAGGSIALGTARTGTSFSANAGGSAGFGTTRTGDSLTVNAGGSIGFGETRTGTTMTADAGGALTVTAATSGGTQRLSSTGDLVFAMLKTDGIALDPGDIVLTSRDGRVLGGGANANRDLIINGRRGMTFGKLDARQDISLVTRDGSVDRALGTSGDVTAGRDLSIDARLGMTFSTLRSGRDMTIRSGGYFVGDDLDIGRNLALNVAGSSPIKLKSIKGDALLMAAGGPVNIGTVTVSTSAAFEVPSIEIGALSYIGETELVLDIAGFEGAVANYARMFVDAQFIRIPRLHVVDSNFSTNAQLVSIEDGFVPGSMEWLTPARSVFMNNRLQVPTLSHDVQLFQPTGRFVFEQLANRTTTNSRVVRYGIGSDIHEMFGNQVYNGASFIRNSEAAMQDASNDLPGLEGRERSLYRQSIDVVLAMFRKVGVGSVTKSMTGPAVNLGAEPQEDERVLEEASLR